MGSCHSCQRILIRSERRVLTRLARWKSTRGPRTWPRVDAVEQTKCAIPNRLHDPKQAQTERDANSVHDFTHNFYGLKPFDFERFRNLHLIRHYELRVRPENQLSKLVTRALDTRGSVLQEIRRKDNVWIGAKPSRMSIVHEI